MESRANSSSTFVPSLRSDEGPRSDDELREIAANAFKIDAYYWLCLYAKMDFQDTRRLFDVLLNSAAKLHIRTQLVSFSAEVIREFLDLECTPEDVPRLQALLPYELADEWPPSHVPGSSSAPRPKPKNAVPSFFETELIALQKRMELKKLVVQNFAECGQRGTIGGRRRPSKKGSVGGRRRWLLKGYVYTQLFNVKFRNLHKIVVYPCDWKISTCQYVMF